ncbi:hypothetical protein Q3G72_004405 [Acer saccharum]|nr:hypothetical protein Q3G72_004405 [Acer saccharum]
MLCGSSGCIATVRCLLVTAWWLRQWQTQNLRKPYLVARKWDLYKPNIRQLIIIIILLVRSMNGCLHSSLRGKPCHIYHRDHVSKGGQPRRAGSAF